MRTPGENRAGSSALATCKHCGGVRRTPEPVAVEPTEPWPVPDPRHLHTDVLIANPALPRPVRMDLDYGERSAWVVEVPCRNEDGPFTLRIKRELSLPAPDPVGVKNGAPVRERVSQSFDNASTYNEVIRGGLRDVNVIAPRDVSMHNVRAVRAGEVIQWQRAVDLGLVPA